MEQLKPEVQRHIDLLIQRYPVLEEVRESIAGAYSAMAECYEAGHKVLIAGNGGSAADAEHMVGELMKGFKLARRIDEEFREKLMTIDPERGGKLADSLQGALPAIALDGHFALSTAYLNDVDGLLCFAQQVYGYGQEGDVLVGISTSGNSKNIMYAVTAAKALGMKVIGLTGAGGGLLADAADVAVKVPEKETFMIQELHLPVYHCLCLMLEEHFFDS